MKKKVIKVRIKTCETCHLDYVLCAVTKSHISLYECRRCEFNKPGVTRPDEGLVYCPAVDKHYRFIPNP